MSSLKHYETVIFEKIFTRSRGAGYVLQFSDTNFHEFFISHGIDIDDQKYRVSGHSKLKRLNTFCKIESDSVVGRMLDELIKYAQAINCIEDEELKITHAIINRLLGIKNTKSESTENTEEQFLNLEFSKVDLTKLDIDTQLSTVVKQRLDEIKICLGAKAFLSVVFLCGSTLEGLLLDTAAKNTSSFNMAKSAYKDKDGKVMPFHQWSLSTLIDVSYELNFLDLNVKKFSHNIRDFRNFIHPRVQAYQNFNPDTHTANICWQVLKASIANLNAKSSR